MAILCTQCDRKPCPYSAQPIPKEVRWVERNDKKIKVKDYATKCRNREVILEGG